MDGRATLEEAREWLRQRVKHGEHCPLCRQYAKVYSRKLNCGMARGLIWLVGACRQSNTSDRWVHIPTQAPRSVISSRELGKLRHWTMVEPKPHTPDKQRTSGYWRVTDLGIEFAHDRITVPRNAKIYNDHAMGLVGPPISIRDALGSKFNYVELMREL